MWSFARRKPLIDGINIEWCMNGSVLIMTSRFDFSPHHDTLITLTYLPALGPSHAHANLADDLDSGNGKYISCSKDGMLVFWGPEFQPQRTVLVSFNHPFNTLFSRFLKCHICSIFAFCNPCRNQNGNQNLKNENWKVRCVFLICNNLDTILVRLSYEIFSTRTHPRTE